MVCTCGVVYCTVSRLPCAHSTAPHMEPQPGGPGADKVWHECIPSRWHESSTLKQAHRLCPLKCITECHRGKLCYQLVMQCQQHGDLTTHYDVHLGGRPDPPPPAGETHASEKQSVPPPAVVACSSVTDVRHAHTHRVWGCCTVLSHTDVSVISACNARAHTFSALLLLINHPTAVRPEKGNTVKHSHSQIVVYNGVLATIAGH